jgi:hypothetical protein
VYLGAWPFESISGATTNVGRVDFQDTTSVMCTHCHQSLNHTAPLFAYYDIQGKYQPTISVPTPLDGAPMAKLDDYIPGSETTAWRYQVPAADLPALGAAMAADPSVQVCGVVRAWNFALGKADVVDALVDVPKGTIAAQIAKFSDNGFKLKDMIFDVFASEDFTKF